MPNPSQFHIAGDAVLTDDAQKKEPSLLPLSLLKSGQFLALDPDCQGGLILHKGFFSDFVGAGAAVGGCFDLKSTAIYTIGMVKFHAPETHQERRQAFQQRLGYIHQLQQIIVEPLPVRRASVLLHQLYEWVGIKEVSKIPHEFMARLIGVYPETIAFAWQQDILKKPVVKKFEVS